MDNRVGFKSNLRELGGKAGRAFLRAFGVGVLTYSTGVLAAPNLDQAFALGVAALASSLAAGFAALQVFVPMLAFQGKYAELANEFLRAGLGFFLVALVGMLNAPDQSFSKAAIVGLLTGALAAGLRAVQGVATPGDTQTKFGTTGT